MSPPRILALDIASHTGIAIGVAGEIPLLMTMKFTREGEAASMDGVVAASARAQLWIGQITQVHKFDRAAIEAPVPERSLQGNTNAWATFLKVGLITNAASALRHLGIPVRYRNIGAVRKFFIGKGNAEGKQAKRAARAVCRLLDWDAKNDDEGDAAALWAYECSQIAPHLAPRVDPISLGAVPYEFFKSAPREKRAAR